MARQSIARYVVDAEMVQKWCSAMGVRKDTTSGVWILLYSQCQLPKTLRYITHFLIVIGDFLYQEPHEHIEIWRKPSLGRPLCGESHFWLYWCHESIDYNSLPMESSPCYDAIRESIVALMQANTLTHSTGNGGKEVICEKRNTWVDRNERNIVPITTKY